MKTPHAKREASVIRRAILTSAGRCINGPLLGFVGQRGTMHTLPKPGEVRCDACKERHRAPRGVAQERSSACSRCGSPAGQNCRTATGRFASRVHAGRLVAAVAAAALALAACASPNPRERVSCGTGPNGAALTCDLACAGDLTNSETLGPCNASYGPAAGVVCAHTGVFDGIRGCCELGTSAAPDVLAFYECETP